jgi:uncharacterized protein YqeY
MSTLLKIKADQLAARKAKNTVATNVLTTLIGEAVAIGKNENRETTDAEIVATVKKFIKNIDEVLKVIDSESTGYHNAVTEKAILADYLPHQLSSLELSSVIGGIIAEIEASGPKDMGRVMKVLKLRYDGQYDGGVASGLIKITLV